MRKLIKTIVLAILVPASLFCSWTSSVALEPFRNPAAEAALLAEVDSGKVLYKYNADRRHPADALTRVMTLMLVVTACESGSADLDSKIEMTENAYYDIDSTSTTQNILPGEEMTLQDLLYCAYIGEASEACNLIAEHVAGSILSFIRSMNGLARDLGCTNTNFTNTHGQYNDNQYTTAMDQFIIYREAMSHPLFVEITSAYRHDVEETNMSDLRRLTNSNSLLNPNSKYYYKPCTSGISGATYEGGSSFVSFAEADGLSLISVVLGSDTIILDDQSAEMRNLTEARRLFEWGLSQFSRRTILSSTDLIGRVPVMHGAGADFVNLRPESSITLLLDNEIAYEDFDRTVTIYPMDGGDTLYAPVYEGDVLGEVVISLNGIEYGTIHLVANTDIELNRLRFIRMQVDDMMASKTAHNIMWALAGIIFVYLLLVVRYNIVRRKRLRRIAEAKKQLKEERRAQSRHW